jgi:hypothetical protein
MPRTFTSLGPLQRRFMLRAMNEGVDLDDELATDDHRAWKLEALGLVHKRTSRKGRTKWRAPMSAAGW